MGAGCSTLDVEFDFQQLGVGDVILFKEISGKNAYMFRSGGWKGYSFPGFVMSVHPDAGPMVCGFFEGDEAGHSCRALASEIESGRYNLCYARRLNHVLTPSKIRLIQDYMNTKTKQDHGSSVCIMMELPNKKKTYNCFNSSSQIDRFFTSPMIAEMLSAAGKAQESTPHMFSSTSADETILQAPAIIYTNRGWKRQLAGVRNTFSTRSQRDAPPIERDRDGVRSAYFSFTEATPENSSRGTSFARRATERA